MKTLIHQTPISKLKLIEKHKTPFSQIDGITIDNERTNSPSIVQTNINESQTNSFDRGMPRVTRLTPIIQTTTRYD